MCALALATTTAAGEPRVSGVDGHVLRGDDVGVFVHGRAQLMRIPQVPAWVEEHLVAHYGWSLTTLGEDIVHA